MSNIFDEKNMMQALEKYLPEGENVRAGIHACASKSHVRRIFSGCILADNTLIPVNGGGIVKVTRSKFESHDIYIGITSRHLVIAECEKYMHFYEYDADIDPKDVGVTEVHEKISLNDIETCYLLEEIQKCEIKKGWMGSVKCNIAMKNGDCFKLMFPKRGGLGGGMPHHGQYRDEIIACLSVKNA
ncbi:hypothetical protein AALB16_02595 [Lachnospiraceae bacterium 62-35]